MDNFPADVANIGTGPEDLPALRRQAIAALADVIYARGPAAVEPDRSLHPEHDPSLLRRVEAVRLLGRFPDPEASTLLSDLLLKGERTLLAPAGRWFRDAALLALLTSRRLPPRAVDRALQAAYSIRRYPFPWQWSRVYAELPLLAQYDKQRVFFRAFWLWPLLILAVPTLMLAGQMLFPQAGTFSVWTVPVVVGTGLEIYLVHQVVIALLTGRFGPLLRLPALTVRGKAWVGAGLSGLVLGLLIVIAVAIVSGEFEYVGSGAVFVLGFTMLLLPLLLLPMFIVAHDLEQTIRYMPKRQSLWLRGWAVILRRITDLIYILLLPTVVAFSWTLTSGDQANLLILPFLMYLFAVPFIVAGWLTLLDRLLRRGLSVIKSLGSHG